MKKHGELLRWITLWVSVALAIGTFAYNGGAKLENHNQRITVLEKNGKLLIGMNEKIDSLLKK